jgi:hypothetical protein|tara:strand:- start:86 stop:385 length:300 start_codon:yes stop_codon:yes gene_type:complete
VVVKEELKMLVVEMVVLVEEDVDLKLEEVAIPQEHHLHKVIVVVMDVMETPMEVAAVVALPPPAKLLHQAVVVMVVKVLKFQQHLKIQLCNQVQLILPV